MVDKYRKEHPDFKHGIYIARPVTFDDDEGSFDLNERILCKVFGMQLHLDGLLR
jgi:hypothetical protein